MPTLEPCVVCGSTEQPQTIADDKVYCPVCANREGVALIPAPATRAATVIQTQCWKYRADGQLEQITLQEPRSRIFDGREVLPMWWVTSKRPPRNDVAIVYASDRPPSDILDRIAREARERWAHEPWMQGP